MLGVSPDANLGVSHLDEVYLLFHTPETDAMMKEKDRKMTKQLINLWTHFATFGNPGETEWRPASFPPTIPYVDYATINLDSVRMMDESESVKFNDDNEFTAEVYKQLGRHDYSDETDNQYKDEL